MNKLIYIIAFIFVSIILLGYKKSHSLSTEKSVVDFSKTDYKNKAVLMKRGISKLTDLKGGNFVNIKGSAIKINDISYGIFKNKLTIATISATLPNGEMITKDKSHLMDRLISDLRNTGPIDLDVYCMADKKSSSVKISGLVLGMYENRNLFVESINLFDEKLERYEWKNLNSEFLTCNTTFSFTCDNSLCGGNCVFDVPTCDFCDCQPFGTGFCTETASMITCVDAGCAASGTGRFCNFQTGPCTCICEDPLPIELIDFKLLKLDSNFIEVSWVTASEVNNDFFSIEKSEKGLNFVEITKIEGAGNSTEQLEYRYIDKNPYNPLSYYRLKQTDFDGQFKYYEIKAIRILDKTNFSILELYPNPIIDFAKITLNNPKHGPVRLEIFDMTGRKLLEESYNLEAGKNTIEIDLSAFQSGNYILVVNGSKGIERIKITKI